MAPIGKADVKKQAGEWSQRREAVNEDDVEDKPAGIALLSLAEDGLRERGWRRAEVEQWMSRVLQ